MDCPECGAAVVAFPVPPDLREVAPGASSSGTAAICPRCLALVDLADADGVQSDPDFARIIEAFPDGEPGAVMAIAVGLLVDSLALHRRTIAELLDCVQAEGVDPWLVLERLDVAPTVRADADLDRARAQLEQLLDT